MDSTPSFGRRTGSVPTLPPATGGRRMSMAPAALPADAPRWAIESDDIDFFSRIPLVAIGLIVLLTLIFMAEQTFGFEPGPAESHRSLVALGADGRNLVLGQGQWWRPVTAILLHGSWEHLIGNSIALMIAGLMLERRLGRAWFASIFVIGGLAGALASLACNPPDMIGVGASGAIMALLIPSLMEAFGNATVYTLKAPRRWVLFMVVSALAPTHSGIDYSAHAGGALAGGGLGYALLFAIPELHAWPRGRIVAASIAGAGAVVAALGFAMVAVNYPAYAAANTQFIPDGELAKITAAKGDDSGSAALGEATDLALRYPKDPRGDMVRAIIHLKAENYIDAEGELRSALAAEPAVADQFPPYTADYLHALLAVALLEQGRKEEAIPEARPLCATRWPSPALVKLKDGLTHAGVCH